jgi:hypothetical protein
MTSLVKTSLVAAAVLVALAPNGGAAAPKPIGPGNYVKRIDNPWFPLKPGTTFRYREQKDGVAAIDIVHVTAKTRNIMGVPATVVHDRLYEHGRVVEDTLDWYGQDKQGNVWYLGEATKELDAHGHVKSRDGSWEWGVHGAEAGIFMPAHPKVGQSFRQEYWKGHAEDHFRIAAIRGNRLRTAEWTPLEPGVRDAKHYVRGTGLVREVTVKGGSERMELVSVR